jgi:hypothetical protein
VPAPVPLPDFRRMDIDDDQSDGSAGLLEDRFVMCPWLPFHIATMKQLGVFLLIVLQIASRVDISEHGNEMFRIR